MDPIGTRRLSSFSAKERSALHDTWDNSMALFTDFDSCLYLECRGEVVDTDPASCRVLQQAPHQLSCLDRALLSSHHGRDLLNEGSLPVPYLDESVGGEIPALASGLAFLKQMAIGLAIVLFLIFEPDGLIHRWRLIKAYWKLYPFSY